MSRNTQKIFGTKAVAFKVPDTVNKEFYPAFSTGIKEQYLQMLLTNTLGNTFYATKEELLVQSFSLNKAIMKEDPVFAAGAIVYARNYGFMRTQPILGLVYLASVLSLKKETFTKAFNLTIKTPNDLIDFVTMLKSVRGNEGGRRVKDAVKAWLVKNLTDYWIIKYGAEKSGEYSLSDVVKIYHPNYGKNDYKLAYLLKKETDLEKGSQLYWYEWLKAAISDETKIMAISNGRLPHEVASTYAGNSKEVWKAIAEEMPTFALLRNLATLERRGLVYELLDKITEKLTNPMILSKAKILPLQMYKAYTTVSTAEVKDILRTGIERTFENLPELGKNVAVMLDVSGSMVGEFLTTSAIFAIALAKKTSYHSKFYIFNNSAYEIAVSKVDSILSQAERIRAGGGTDTSAPVVKMINGNVLVDTIILVTDEQQNLGSSFYSEVERYKRLFSKPNLKVFVINVAPYAASSVAPKDTKNYYHIFGWSEKVLEFISMANLGFSNLVQMVQGTLNDL